MAFQKMAFPKLTFQNSFKLLLLIQLPGGYMYHHVTMLAQLQPV